MDIRRFMVNGYMLEVKRNIGPGPYLYTNGKGREQIADSGDFLVMQHDKPVAHLPGDIVDAMALDTKEQFLVERTRRIADDKEVQDKFVVNVEAGEKFDGQQVLDKDGQPIEGRELQKAKILRQVSTDEIKGDGELKTKEDKEKDVKAKEFAVTHPVNIFNEAAGRAAREVADLAAKRVANHDQDMKDLEELTESQKGTAAANVDKMRDQQFRSTETQGQETSQTHKPESDVEKQNRLKSLNDLKDSQPAASTRQEMVDDFGFLVGSLSDVEAQSKAPLVSAAEDKGPGLTPGQKQTLANQRGPDNKPLAEAQADANKRSKEDIVRGDDRDPVIG